MSMHLSYGSVCQVGVIYIEKGIELLIHEFEASGAAAGWLACFIAVVLSFSMYYMEAAGKPYCGQLRHIS